MGGGKISGSFGTPYRDWLSMLHPGSHGNADLCAHFFRRAETLIGDNGVMGFIATNTISQGDTRATGLKHLLSNGWEIYSASTDIPWGAQ